MTRDPDERIRRAREAWRKGYKLVFDTVGDETAEALFAAVDERDALRELAAFAVDERDALRKRVAELEELYGWLRGDVPSHSLRWPRWKIERWSGKWWEEIRGDAMDAAIKADKEGLLK